MVRVYPITPQSQFKNNSRATVPLKWQCGEIFWNFFFMNRTNLAPDKQAKLVLLKDSFSRGPACLINEQKIAKKISLHCHFNVTAGKI